MSEREAVWVKIIQGKKDERLIGAVILEIPKRLLRGAMLTQNEIFVMISYK